MIFDKTDEFAERINNNISQSTIQIKKISNPIDSNALNDSNHYLCPLCHTFPKLILKENKKVEIHCIDIKGSEMDLNNFMEYMLTKGDINKYALSDYIGYCFDCQKDFEEIHSNEHKNHNIKYFKDIYEPKLNFIRNKLNIPDSKKEVSISESESFISGNSKNKIDSTIKYEIGKDNEYVKKEKQNYLDNLYINNPFGKLIQIIIQDSELYPNYIHYENIKNIFYYLSDQLKIEYYNYNYENQSSDIRIFGENFVENNDQNFILIIDGKEENLKEKIKVEGPNKTLEIKLIKVNEPTDLSGMFYKCDCLTEINIINTWNTSNVTSMSGMFYGCKVLKKLPDISEWETNAITDLSSMFEGCEILEFLPDLSKWNVENVKNMSNMFCGCESLHHLPDLSKWKTYKLKTISSIFQNCKNLISLGGLVYWNTSQITDMSYAFQNCLSLTDLGDISKDISEWKTENVTSFSNMFAECKSLIKLPDLSKWETQNAKEMNYMFSNCNKLETIPDISKWNVEHVISMNNMFENCSSLKIIPDISNWKKNKDLDTNFMFRGCNSLKEKPNLYN